MAILCMRPVNKRAMCQGGLNQLIFSLMCYSVVHLLHFGFYKKQRLLSRKKETTIQSKAKFDIINLKQIRDQVTLATTIILV